MAAGAGCTDTWIATAGGTWDTASDWSTGAVPGSSDSVCISAGGTYQVLIGDESISVASLTVGGTGSNPTLMIGNNSGGEPTVTVSGSVFVDTGATISDGFSGSFSAGSLTNAGTFEVPNGTDTLGIGNITNSGTLSVVGAVALSLSAGSTFENQGGTITNSGALAISTAGSSATVQLDSGGVLDNTGPFTVQDTLLVDGGTICGNPVQIGNADGGNGGALHFATSPGTGPSCPNGTPTDGIQVLNVAATLSGTIPSTYAVTVGDNGSGLFAVSLSGSVVNDGTLDVGNADIGTLSATSSSDYLTNDGTITVPSNGGANLDVSLVNNGAVNLDASTAAVLEGGSAWENTGSGTITLASSESLAISSPVNQTATLKLEPGGEFDNLGTTTVGDDLAIDGGSICGNPIELGTGDGGTGGALEFASSPGSGPACSGGVTNDEIQVLNVAATLSGAIPASYTVTAGDSGAGSATISLSGSVVNDGSFDVGNDTTATLSAADSSDSLTNDGNLNMPAGGGANLNVPLVNNGVMNVEATANASLQDGWSWQNGSSGVISVASAQTLSITSPSGQTGEFEQAGTIDNAGTIAVADAVVIGGGTICENALNLGSGDGGSGATLSFAASPAAGPPCPSGQNTDGIFVYDVAATVESDIPAGYTISSGDSSGAATISTPGDLTNAGTMQLGNGTTWDINAGNGTLTNTGTIEVPGNQGDNTINGDLANSGGDVEIGSSATNDGSTLTVAGDYTQDADATLAVELGGTSAGSGYGQLDAVGGSTVAGTLDAETDSGFSVSPTDSFEIIDSGAVSGAFDTFLGQYPSGQGAAYSVAYDPSDVTLSVATATTQTLTVNPSGTGSGTITSSPAGIDCSSTCVGGFPQGQAVVLTETPASGTVFDGWSGACTGTSTTCNVTMSADQTVGAQFSTATATSTSVGSSQSPSQVAQQVTFTATVTPTPDGGAVAFTDGGAPIDNCGLVPVDTGTGEATCQTSFSSVGSQPIQAHYSGDPDFAGSQSSSFNQVVNPTATTITLQSSSNPATTGGELTFTATVSPVPDGGTVTFTHGGPPIAACTSVPVNTSTGEAFCQIDDLDSGSYTLEADYSGDTNYAGSDSSTLDQIDNPASTSTSLTASPNPATVGQQVTFTATVTPVPNGGTVEFTSDGTTIAGCGSVQVDTITGQAACQTTFPASGSHTIQASYSGNPAFATSLGSTSEVINPTRTSTSVTASSNPAQTLQQVTFTATVSPVPDGGAVSFTDNGTAIPGCSAVSVTTTTGQASCPVTYFSTGNHAIQASYSGDADFGVSQGSTNEVVSTQVTSIDLASSANPSSLGQQVTFIATVSPPPDAGSVAFTDGGSTISGCGSVAVNSSSGQATCQTSYGAAGSHSIEASYSGDPLFSPTQAGLTQVVSRTPTTTSLQSSVNPVTAGQSAIYTATVSPTPDGGTVKFADGGSTIAGCGSVAVDLSSSQATCQTTYSPNEPGGTHPITASYSGDANFVGSQSSTVNEGLTALTATTVKLTASASPYYAISTTEQLVATVSPHPDGGSITWTYDGQPIPGCSGSLNADGLSQCGGFNVLQISSLTPGQTYTLEASYAGDTSFAPAQASVSVVYKKYPSRVTLAASPSPETIGQPVVYTAALSAPPKLLGTISYTDNGSPIPGCTYPVLVFIPTCTVTYNQIGGHQIQATYTGSDLNAGASATINVNANPPAPTGTLAVGQPTLNSPSPPACGSCLTKVTITPPATPPAPCSLGSAKSSTYSIRLSGPVGTGAVMKLANQLQSMQTSLQGASSSRLQSALAADAGCTSGAGIAGWAGTLATPPQGVAPRNDLGPSVADVLAAVYARTPSKDDVSAFLEEMLIARSSSASPARTIARLTLADAVALGDATFARQFGDRRLSQLRLGRIVIASTTHRGPEYSGDVLTLKPSTQGARILRILAIDGLYHRVGVTATVSEKSGRHTRRTVRTIRVI
jgi:large repetitive protein